MSSSKEYMVKYREENKEQIAEYRKQYYVNHKEEEKERSKQYYEDNKTGLLDRHKEYLRNYNEKNKERVYGNYSRWLNKENEVTKKYSRKRRAKWTDEEEKMLFELQDEGLTYTEIALALGRSRDSVKCKMGRIQKKQQEAKDELQDLIELWSINSSLGGE